MATTFRYRGLKTDGRLVEGRVRASDEDDAVLQLSAQQISAYELIDDTVDRSKFARRKARPADYQRLVRQLAILVKAGSPLLASIDILFEDEPCEELHKRIKRLRQNLKSGGRLSSALTEHLSELPNYVPRLVELGEATGSLAERLNESAEQMERDTAAADEMRNALAYPAFLASAGLLAVLLIFTFVVPRFSSLLEGTSAEIPLLSRIVLQIGTVFAENLVAVGVSLTILLVMIVRASRSKNLRASIIDFMFRVPVARAFLKSVDSARWARVMGAALAAGSSLLDALILAERGVMSRRNREGMAQVRKAVRAGDSLEVALQAHTDFEAVTLNLLRTGRLSGNLAEMLLFVAQTEEAQARNQAKRLIALAEPMAIAFIATVIGIIVVSLVLAMSSLYDFQI